MKTVRSAGIVVFNNNNGKLEYLLLLYPGGYWEFPKGKLEPGESDEVAAHRELKEETNLEVQLIPGFEEEIAYTFKDRQGETILKEVIFYVGQAEKRAVILSAEHRDYRWLTFPEAVGYVSHANARELLQKVHDFVVTKINI